jgi:hypothetical protein
MTYDITKSMATRSALSQLKWAFSATALTLAACGGGGGDNPVPASPAPTPIPPVVLNAQEELAYQSWALRQVSVEYVTDDDESSFSALFSYGGRIIFAGRYPAGAGNGTGSNLPPPAGASGGLCKDGGTQNKTDTLINNNNTYDAGESFVTTYLDCKDPNTLLNGTRKFSYKATSAYYSAPNDKAIKSALLDITWDTTYLTSAGYTTSKKGVLGIDISDQPLRRLYTLKELVYAFDQGSVVANTLLIGINRSDEFGADKPFTVAGFAGSVTIDGKPYTVSSTANIPWLKTVGYFPKSGSITATSANGDKVITEFTATGAKCRLVPSGTTTASVTVEQCSKI